MRRLPFTAALLVLVAGCVEPGGDGPAPPAEAAALAADPVVTSTTGAIAGVVTDEAYQPLAGANVSLRDTDLGFATDVEGAFTVSGLAGGEHTLLVAHVGYDSVALVARVAPGEVTRVVATLAELAVVEPYVTPYEWGGRIGCAAAGVGGGPGSVFVVPCAGTDENTKNYWLFDVQETVRTLVVTIAWRSTGYVVGGEMQVFVEACLSPAEVTCPEEKTYAFAAGPSPLVARVEGADLTGPQPFVDGTAPARIRVAPGSSQETSPSVVLEQPFTVYVNLFHHAPAPPGFTGVPDA